MIEYEFSVFECGMALEIFAKINGEWEFIGCVWRTPTTTGKKLYVSFKDLIEDYPAVLVDVRVLERLIARGVV